MIQTLAFLVNLLPLFVGTLWGAADRFTFLEAQHLKLFLAVLVEVATVSICASMAHDLLAGAHLQSEKSESKRKSRSSQSIATILRLILLTFSALVMLGGLHFFRAKVSTPGFVVLGIFLLTSFCLPWCTWRKALGLRSVLLGIRFSALCLLSFVVLISEITWSIALISLGSACLFVAAEIGSLYARNYKELVSRKASKNLRRERLLRIAKAQMLLIFLGPVLIVFLCMIHQIHGLYTLLLLTTALGPQVHQQGVELAEELSSNKNPSLRQARQYFIQSLSIVAIFFCIVAGLGIVL